MEALIPSTARIVPGAALLLARRATQSGRLATLTLLFVAACWGRSAWAEPPADVTPDTQVACGWTPTQVDPTPTHVVRAFAAGCGVHEVDNDRRVVQQIRVVELSLEPHATVVRYVLLDGEGRRVVFESDQALRHELLLRRTQKGVTRVRSTLQTDGVYELKLGAGERPDPCELHLFLRFDNGTEVLEEWLDDWLYSC